MTGESPGETRLVVAQVRGLHGLQGVVRIEVLTDQPELRFVEGSVLHREGTSPALTIIESAAVEDGPGWRLRFAEIRSRNAAEALRDVYLETIVDRSQDLEPGSAYWHEVIGCEVRALDGRVLGTVADIYRVASAEIFVVRGGPSGEFDLPLVKAIVREFAPERGVITVDEAVLDLDGDPVDERPPKPPRKRPRWSRHGKGAAEASGNADTEPDADGASSPLPYAPDPLPDDPAD